MAHARRIERLADCPTSSGKRVEFQFEGRAIEGFTEEPLAVALLAAGIRVFGRSVKYHRPRGPACLRAHCSGCLMRVDQVRCTRCGARHLGGAPRAAPDMRLQFTGRPRILRGTPATGWAACN